MPLDQQVAAPAATAGGGGSSLLGQHDPLIGVAEDHQQPVVQSITQTPHHQLADGVESVRDNSEPRVREPSQTSKTQLRASDISDYRNKPSSLTSQMHVYEIVHVQESKGHQLEGHDRSAGVLGGSVESSSAPSGQEGRSPETSKAARKSDSNISQPSITTRTRSGKRPDNREDEPVGWTPPSRPISTTSTVYDQWNGQGSPDGISPAPSAQERTDGNRVLVQGRDEQRFWVEPEFHPTPCESEGVTSRSTESVGSLPPTVLEADSESSRNPRGHSGIPLDQGQNIQVEHKSPRRLKPPSTLKTKTIYKQGTIGGERGGTGGSVGGTGGGAGGSYEPIDGGNEFEFGGCSPAQTNTTTSSEPWTWGGDAEDIRTTDLVSGDSMSTNHATRGSIPPTETQKPYKPYDHPPMIRNWHASGEWNKDYVRQGPYGLEYYSDGHVYFPHHDDKREYLCSLHPEPGTDELQIVLTFQGMEVLFPPPPIGMHGPPVARRAICFDSHKRASQEIMDANSVGHDAIGQIMVYTPLVESQLNDPNQNIRALYHKNGLNNFNDHKMAGHKSRHQLQEGEDTALAQKLFNEANEQARLNNDQMRLDSDYARKLADESDPKVSTDQLKRDRALAHELATSGDSTEPIEAQRSEEKAYENIKKARPVSMPFKVVKHGRKNKMLPTQDDQTRTRPIGGAPDEPPTPPSSHDSDSDSNSENSTDIPMGGLDYEDEEELVDAYNSTSDSTPVTPRGSPRPPSSLWTPRGSPTPSLKTSSSNETPSESPLQTDCDEIIYDHKAFKLFEVNSTTGDLKTFDPNGRENTEDFPSRETNPTIYALGPVTNPIEMKIALAKVCNDDPSKFDQDFQGLVKWMDTSLLHAAIVDHVLKSWTITNVRGRTRANLLNHVNVTLQSVLRAFSKWHGGDPKKQAYFDWFSPGSEEVAMALFQQYQVDNSLIKGATSMATTQPLQETAAEHKIATNNNLKQESELLKLTKPKSDKDDNLRKIKNHFKSNDPKYQLKSTTTVRLGKPNFDTLRSNWIDPRIDI